MPKNDDSYTSEEDPGTGMVTCRYPNGEVTSATTDPVIIEVIGRKTAEILGIKLPSHDKCNSLSQSSLD